MEGLPPEVQDLLGQLEEAPRRLAEVAAGLTTESLDLRTPMEPWSIGDVLAHLRASADVRTKFIQVMLEGKPAPRYVSPRSYIKKTGYIRLAFHESLPAYTEQRTRLLVELRGLSAEQWSKSATIRDRKEDVLTFARYLAQHEALHCEQVERLAGLVRQG